MKAKDLVAQVATTCAKEYQELCRLWETGLRQAEVATKVPNETLEKIIELTSRIRQKLFEAEEKFLEQITASYRRRQEAPGVFRITSQSGIPNVRAGQKAFLQQIQKQMPVFYQVFEVFKNADSSQIETAANS